MAKKLLFLALLLAILSFPSFGNAVSPSGPTMQLSITITSFRMPARAAESNYANPQSTEFIIGSNRVIVVKNDTGTISVSGTSVVGTNTHFTQDFGTQQYITTINAKDSGGKFIHAESHVITAITDDTHMTTDAWVTPLNNVAYSGPIMGGIYINTSGPPYSSIYPLSFPYDSTQSYSVYFGVLAYAVGASDSSCKADCSTVPAGSGWYTLSSYYGGCASPTPCNTSIYYGTQNVAVDGASVYKDSTYSGNSYWRILLQTIPAS